jgi:hypothetical protein
MVEFGCVRVRSRVVVIDEGEGPVEDVEEAIEHCKIEVFEYNVEGKDEVKTTRTKNKKMFKRRTIEKVYLLYSLATSSTICSPRSSSLLFLSLSRSSRRCCDCGCY